MFAKLRGRCRSFLDHPLVRLELRRVRRKRWWPGRRAYVVVPVLWGVLLGYAVTLALGDALGDALGVLLAAVVTGVPLFCLLSATASLLAFVLPWIAPVLTASTIARERELGTLDLLRVTLLTGRSIVLGKSGACMVRLWPGIGMLLLLAPFRPGASVGGRVLSVTDLSGLEAALTSGMEQRWVWLLITGVLMSVWRTLRSLSDLVFHAAVGMFVSALVRSPAVAIAASYAFIITMRVALWLGRMFFFGLSTVWLMDVLEGAWMVPGLATVAPVLGEAAAAALLLWAAVRRLKRE
jgi:hypothetical protein